MLAVDQRALSRELHFAEQAIAKIVERVPQEQESITVWDDAVVRTKALDVTWMADNVGEWMHSYFGHTAVYVLNAANEPIYAMRDGATIDPAEYASDAAEADPLARALRAQIAGAAPDAALGELGSSDVVLRDGRPAVVSVKPIVPYTADIAVEPQSLFFHVSVQDFNEQVLRHIAETYGLRHLRLSDTATSSPASAPILDAGGQTLARIAWAGDAPGSNLLWSAAPGLLVAMLIGGVLLYWLLSRIKRSTTALHASEARAHFLAFHDTLTGLPNRAFFEDRLDWALAGMRHSGKQLALHSIDVDQFKTINDTRGHPAGDELIRAVARRLHATVPATDLVARLGGDEFVVLQRDVNNSSEARAAAARLLAAIAETYDLLGVPTRVTASIGVVIASEKINSREELMRRADIALYEAKARGRARYELFAASMDEVLKHRRMIEEELRLALELGNQLKLVYQPLFSADAKRIVGAEAL